MKLLVSLGLALSLSTPAFAGEEHSKTVHVLIISDMALSGIDNGQSLYLFGKDPNRFKEANPALRWAQGNPTEFGIAKLGMSAGLSLLDLWLDKKWPDSKAVKWSLIVKNAVMTGVVVRNARFQ